jgi:hypothetical protein
MTAREYTPDELLRALRQRGRQLAERFFQPCSDLDALIRWSVGGNTFRSFRKLSRPPSVIFREWAARRIAPRMAALAAIRHETGYNQHLEEQASDLSQYWLQEGEKPLPYGPGRKLLDLLFKGVVRHADIPIADRDRLIEFLHVPLDSFSLLAIRQCARSGAFGPRIDVPPTAKMGFVTAVERYNGIQEIIRRVAVEAGVAPICIDLVAWDQAHGS